MKKPLASIIIVNYRNQKLVLKCVTSIISLEKKLNYEIIVVDNNSTDNTEILLKSIYPQLVWIQMGYNSGFGRANNVGIKKAKGDYILLLNNDTILNDSVISLSLKEYMRKEVAGLMTIKLLSENKTPQYSASNNFPSLNEYINANPLWILFSRGKQKFFDRKKKELDNLHRSSGYVKWISGAFVLFRKELLKENMLFDEDYFMYSEDVDSCFTLNLKRYKHYYYTGAEITHINGGSSTCNISRYHQIFASELLFIRKNRGTLYYLLCCSVLIFNYYLDSFLSKRKGKSLGEYDLLKYNILKKYFYSILVYRFRKESRYGYLKVI